MWRHAVLNSGCDDSSPRPSSSADPHPPSVGGGSQDGDDAKPTSSNNQRPTSGGDARPKKRKKRGHRIDDAPREDPKTKGLFYISNLDDPKPLGNDTDACHPFCCVGLAVKRDDSGKVISKGKKYWSAHKIPMSQLELIGNHFLGCAKDGSLSPSSVVPLLYHPGSVVPMGINMGLSTGVS